MSKDRSTSGGTVTGAGGFQTGRGASANRLPTAPRERKPALAALAVLLILAGALSTMLLVTRSGNRVDVVMMKNTLAVGQKISMGDLTDVSVAADNGIPYVKWNQAGQLVGRTTYNPLVAGSILIPAMLGTATTSSAPAGTTVVGVQVKHYPFQMLYKGDKVNVYGSVASGTTTSGQNNSVTKSLGTAQIAYYSQSGDSLSVTLAATPDVVESIIAAGDTITLTKTIG